VLLNGIAKVAYILFVSNAKFNIKPQANTVVLWVTKLSDLKCGYQHYGKVYCLIVRAGERMLSQNDATNQSHQMPLFPQVILTQTCIYGYDFNSIMQPQLGIRVMICRMLRGMTTEANLIDDGSSCTFICKLDLV